MKRKNLWSRRQVRTAEVFVFIFSTNAENMWRKGKSHDLSKNLRETKKFESKDLSHWDNLTYLKPALFTIRYKHFLMKKVLQGSSTWRIHFHSFLPPFLWDDISLVWVWCPSLFELLLWEGKFLGLFIYLFLSFDMNLIRNNFFVGWTSKILSYIWS